MCENTIDFARIAGSAKNARVKEVFSTLATEEKKLCIQFQLHPINYITLVLGDIESGRRIFTRWIAGNDINFESQPDKTNVGEYVIVDPNEKAYESSSIPILVVNPETNATYYDFPAITDSTEEAHNIAAAYFKQIVIEHLSGVKMCSLIEYHKVIYSLNYLDDWRNLLNHVTEVFTDVNKVKSSVVLVVTKIPRAFYTTPDDQIIDMVVHNIQEQLKPALIRETDPDEVEASEIIKFLDLLTSKEGNNYPRVTLFRSPSKQGPLSSDDLLKNSKTKVEEKLKNLNFNNKTSNDFVFTISEAYLYDITMISNEIRSGIINDVETSCNEVQKYFSAKEAMINLEIFNMDLTHVYEEMKSGYQKLLAIKTSASASANLKQCLNRFIDGVAYMIDDVIKLNMSSTLDSIEGMKFFHTITGSQHIEFTWCVHGLAHIIRYLDDSQKWYHFAKTLYSRILNCNSNKNMGIYNIVNEDLGKKVSETNLKAFLLRNTNEEQLFTQYDNIKDVQLTEFKLNSARQISNLMTKYLETLQICLPKNSTEFEGPSICDIYNARLYINDFHHLEQKIHNLSNFAFYLPYYQSLYARVEEYAENMATNKLSNYRSYAPLNHLLIAILSRIQNIDNSIDSYLVIDDLNFYSFEKHVDIYNQKLKGVRTAVYREKYENIINMQIIKTYAELESISSDMDKLHNKIDDEIRILLKLMDDNREEQQLIKHLAALASLLWLKTLMGALKVANTASIFWGLMATVASGARGLIVTNFDGYLNSSECCTATSMIEGVQQFGDSMKNGYLLEKQTLRENLLHIDIGNLSLEVTKLIADDQDYKKIISNIGNLTTLLDNDYLTLNNYWEAKKYTNEELDRYYELLLQEKANLRNSITDNKEAKLEKCLALSKWTEYVKGVISVVEIGIDQLENTQQNEYLIRKVTESIKQVDGTIRRLMEYKHNIRANLLPEIDTIQANMTQVLQNSTVKPRAVLDKSRQMLQDLVRDFKRNTDFIVQIPTVDSYLINKQNLIAVSNWLLVEMNSCLQIYNRIQSYEDRARLAHYFDNLRSESSPIDYPCLSQDIERLELQIRPNLVLQEYQIALCTFKHYIFPFANSFSQRFNITPYFQGLDIANLMETAFQQMKDLRGDLLTIKTGHTRLPDPLHSNLPFNVTNVQKAPFFTWRHDSHREKISNLLQGRQITMKADIMQIPHQGNVELNAVKFGEISIRFTSPNKTAENILVKLMGNFLVQMTHLGDSHYRCNNEYYVFDHSWISITHSVNTRNNLAGIPHYYYLDASSLNMKSNNHIFSPYATWKIVLLSRSAVADQSAKDFENLNVFQNEQIDLALVGWGGYVDFPARSCENLEKYYKLDEFSKRPSYSDYQYDPNAPTNSANCIKSPIHWLTCASEYLTTFWVLNGMHRHLIRDYFRSIHCHKELLNYDSTKDYVTAATTSLKINVNESLTLADFFIRWLTKVKLYTNRMDESSCLIETRAFILNLVEQMENLMHFNFPDMSDQLDALALTSKLEKELMNNRNATAIINILYQDVVDANPNFNHSTFSVHLRQQITKIVMGYEKIT